MSEVLKVLRDKRADIAAQVHEAEKKLTKLRAALANLDAATAILSPEHPDHIPSRKKYLTGYFSRAELPRLVRDTLRQSAKPLTSGEIAAACIAAKALPPSAHAATVTSVCTVLNIGARRGEFARHGKTRGAKWAVVV